MKKLLIPSLHVRQWLHPYMSIVLLSIIAWIVSYTSGLIFIYNDAMSHINISRLVIDNQEPGIAQIGSVWLPLNHILPLLFVWNDWLWRTGLAGSIFSMLSYILSVIAIGKTVLLITKNRIASFVGGLAFAANLNILYLQTTPLTEPLYIALFALSVLTFTLYLTKMRNTKYLLFLGLLGFLQVAARYDGWFVVVIQALLIGVNEIWLNKKTMQEYFGKLFLYGLPVFLGISLWVIWNGLIFGNPFFFAFGEYSAHTQQRVIEESGELIAKGNIVNSLLAYGYAVVHNVGLFVLILSLFGVGSLYLLKHNLKTHKKSLLLALLVAPILFNVLALFLGFSTISVPEMQGEGNLLGNSQWFNVRYGLLALPFTAVLLGLLATWKKVSYVVVLLVILLQGILMYQNGIVTILDGTVGSSSFQNHAVSRFLKSSVGIDDTVLLSVAVFNPVAFESNIQLRQVIHEGVSKKWHEALTQPHMYADWVVMSSNAKRGDPVYRGLVENNDNNFLSYYEKVYEDKEATIYKIKNNDALSQIKELKK